jgi:hypothetical protein
MFFVYCGYTTPDRHDEADGHRIYELLSFNTQKEVLDHHEKFHANLHGECRGVIYRVISGQELRIEPVEKVVQYKLVADDDTE